jgi:TRAP-type mannitol/chloroaromatic compound transport system permease small subunit
VSALLRAIEGINRGLFRFAGWLSFALTGLVFAVVALRYLWSTGSVALQETALYLHAALFTLAAAGALARGEHVRVDALSVRFSERGRAWVELLGTVLLLLPFAAGMLWLSWDYVHRAWAIRERSSDPGGLPYLYLFKTLIPLLSVQLLAQGLVELHKAWKRLRGRS